MVSLQSFSSPLDQRMRSQQLMIGGDDSTLSPSTVFNHDQQEEHRLQALLVPATGCNAECAVAIVIGFFIGSVWHQRLGYKFLRAHQAKLRRELVAALDFLEAERQQRKRCQKQLPSVTMGLQIPILPPSLRGPLPYALLADGPVAPSTIDLLMPGRSKALSLAMMFKARMKGNNPKPYLKAA